MTNATHQDGTGSALGIVTTATAATLWQHADGITLDRGTGSAAEHTRGYWIGGAAAGIVLDADTPAADAVDAVRVWLSALPDTVAYVGTWTDDGRVYVDASDWLGSRAAAVALGRTRGEISVWDIAAGVERPCMTATQRRRADAERTAAVLGSADIAERAAAVTGYRLGSLDRPRPVAGIYDACRMLPVTPVSLSADDAAAVAGGAATNPVLSALVPAVRDILPSIADELRVFASVGAEHRRLSALVGALCSPGLLLDVNITVARRIIAAWDHIGALCDAGHQDDAVQYIGDTCYAGAGGRCSGYTVGGYIVRSLDIIRQFVRDGFTADDLEHAHRTGWLVGAGPKVRAFALALVDPFAPRFTLDTHMIRLLSYAFGLPYVIDGTLTAARYRLCESALLAWCDDTFPGVPYFAVQWALWDCVFGYHRVHTGFFVDDAE